MSVSNALQLLRCYYMYMMRSIKSTIWLQNKLGNLYALPESRGRPPAELRMPGWVWQYTVADASQCLLILASSCQHPRSLLLLWAAHQAVAACRSEALSPLHWPCWCVSQPLLLLILLTCQPVQQKCVSAR